MDGVPSTQVRVRLLLLLEQDVIFVKLIPSLNESNTQHGNKAATSPTGSADLLTSLGAHLATLTPPYLHHVYDQTPFVFLLAPTYHPGMAHVAHIRKEIGVRTIF